MCALASDRAVAALPEQLRALLTPAAYPHPVANIELLETTLSWVLVTGERTYKLKRPVCYPFVDQRRLEDRRRLCHEELRLNRRFAPQLYLEVCPITLAEGGARIGGAGAPIEYGVVMRTFDRRDQLDQLVLSQRLCAGEVERFGGWLARAHEQLPKTVPTATLGRPAAVAAAIARNAAECLAASAVFNTGLQVSRLAERLAREVEVRQTALSIRAETGCLRECHADLHLSNLVRLNGALLAFDCLEFDPQLRWIDTAQDVAFLCADLQGYEEPKLAAQFLNAYLAGSGDYNASVVLPLYIADRALVRAKVMAMQAGLSGGQQARGGELLRLRHQRYLNVAERSLEPHSPRCHMMMGLPGSGKSWLAVRLASDLAAVVIRSDLERKRLAGLDPLAASHSPPAAGIYGVRETDLVYERLARCALEVLSGRRNVILDANFGKRRHRQMIADLCRRMGVPLTVVRCEAPGTVLQQRIVARSGAAQDPSEADLSILELQSAEQELIARDECLNELVVDTTREDGAAQVLKQFGPSTAPVSGAAPHPA
jgi:uncharacterized protein